MLYVPRPQEPNSSSSNKGSTLIAGCIWCFVVSVPEARFAGAEGHPVALASLEISSRCCSCWSVLSSPSFPLFPPWGMWSLPGGLATVQLPSPGPTPSLDREPSHRGSGIWNGAQRGRGRDCGRRTPWASVCEGGGPGTASQLLSMLMNCIPSGEGWASPSVPLGGADCVRRGGCRVYMIRRGREGGGMQDPSLATSHRRHPSTLPPP